MVSARICRSDGIRLALREPNDRRTGPPVVLLHGWASSSGIWDPIFYGPLADDYRLFAPDLRGHGASDKPAGGYDSPHLWAADVAAVLGHTGTPAVLVGWSYGGLVLLDYLRIYGTADVAGVVLVDAVTEIGRGRRGGRIGPTMRAALPDALSEDPAVAVPALAAFVDGMTPTPGSGPLRQRMLGTALATPPAVRAAAFARTVDSSPVLQAIDIPVLVVHGAEDTVVDPSAGAFAAETIPHAAHHVLPGVGHLPFVERPEAFSSLLDEFLSRCFEVVHP